MCLGVCYVSVYRKENFYFEKNSATPKTTSYLTFASTVSRKKIKKKKNERNERLTREFSGTALGDDRPILKFRQLYNSGGARRVKG